jgi:hypothetical protein
VENWRLEERIVKAQKKKHKKIIKPISLSGNYIFFFSALVWPPSSGGDVSGSTRDIFFMIIFIKNNIRKKRMKESADEKTMKTLPF